MRGPLVVGAFLCGAIVSFGVLSTARPDVFHGALLQIMGEAKPVHGGAGAAVTVLSYSWGAPAADAGHPPDDRHGALQTGASSDADFYPGNDRQCPDFAVFRPHLEDRLRWWRDGSLRRNVIAAMPKLVARLQIVPKPPSGNASLSWVRSSASSPLPYSAMPQRYEPVDAFMSIGTGYRYMDRPQATIRNIVRAIEAAAAWDIHVPPVDLPLYPEDMPPPVSLLGVGEAAFRSGAPYAPFFGPSESPESLAVAVPDFSFEGWGENGIGPERAMDYPTLLDAIVSATAKRPYKDRIPMALFRGQDWVDERKAVFSALQADPPILDLVASDTLDAKRDTPLVSFSRWAVQLYLPGNGYSARFKYLLATGSPVVAYTGAHRGHMTEWWAPLLQPGVHYIPAATPAAVREAVEWLLEHPAAAEKIGKAGQAFVLEHVTQQRALCHWLYALRVYTRKLAALPVLPDASARTLGVNKVYPRYHALSTLASSPEEVAARAAWNEAAGEEPEDDDRR